MPYIKVIRGDMSLSIIIFLLFIFFPFSINVVKSKPSVVDVSEEFSWRQNDSNGSRFNSSIIMHVHEESIKQEHEGRTAFND